nr:helix-turn-helix transcriptional regulator [uncultured Schaedlerella sp.]
MNNIRKLRKKNQMSQKELSHILGISQQSISRIEKADETNISSGLLMKLAEIFHVSMESLVGEHINIYPEEQEAELRKVYCSLDKVNRTTLLVIGQRLYEAQQDFIEKQAEDRRDKDCDM